MTKWILLPLLLCSSASLAAETLAGALEQARARRAPVIVDFHAPWCYSCYFMARNVLTGTDWERVRAQSVILDVDVDSPDGAQLMQDWQVKAIPSYVVLNEAGEELGRILGEQTRADFYRQLGAILARGSPLTRLRQRALQPDAAGAAAAAEVLAAYHARRDGEGGFEWWLGLPLSVRGQHAADPLVSAWRHRLEFLRDSAREDLRACQASGRVVLQEVALGCDYAYELQRYLGCTAPLPAAERRSRLAALQPAPLPRLATDADRCADVRSITFATADLHLALGDTEAAAGVWQQAIRRTREALDGDLRRDRNLADNLRVYLERSKDHAQLDALMPQLIAAYPDDYVYPYRHGRSLLARGEAARALPYLEQAAALAYGVNRLNVAEQRVQALLALGRATEARRVVAQTLKANGPWFPEQAARLKALVPAR